MISTAQVQARLLALGYDPGPIDGLRGRRTIAAIRAYQDDNGMVADGLVGGATAELLFGAATATGEVPDLHPWFDMSRHILGLHEERDNTILSDFLASDGGTAGDPALIPWCADFVQTCIALTLPEEPLPSNPYMSASWTRFGRQVAPQTGAILVFWRDAPESWKGHVGFYAGETEAAFVVRGGNQSDRVSDTHIGKEFLRDDGCRWPATALDPPR